MDIEIQQGEALKVLAELAAESVDFIYIDPPFNTGKKQRRLPTGMSYEDNFGGDYIEWLRSHILQARRVLKPDGSLFVHVDHHEGHYVKVMLDEVFGRDHFMNEIIWAYDYGGRAKRWWSRKHDTIFWYVKDPKNYTFNFDEIDRIPYMAPSLVGAEKAARGKTPTDVHWHTIVPTTGKEKTGYPTQKPLGLLRRFISVHTNPGDFVLDFFAGSGTTGEACAELGRNVLLVDRNPEAVAVMRTRLARYISEDKEL
jgi:site-specific DNA-methyltransferase (adenine-specific)